jgi:hypothetical protein
MDGEALRDDTGLFSRGIELVTQLATENVKSLELLSAPVAASATL